MTTFLVTSGQTLSGVTLASGDTEAVLFGGTATSTIINGGFQDDAGTATNTTINGGYQFVESGGTASNTTVYSGAEQLVMSGGTAAGTTINSGSIEIIESRGTATGAIINGGQQYVNSGGVASNRRSTAAYRLCRWAALREIRRCTVAKSS